MSEEQSLVKFNYLLGSSFSENIVPYAWNWYRMASKLGSIDL
jgi:hypothetical protein